MRRCAAEMTFFFNGLSISSCPGEESAELVEDVREIVGIVEKLPCVTRSVHGRDAAGGVRTCFTPPFWCLPIRLRACR